MKQNLNLQQVYDKYREDVQIINYLCYILNTSYNELFKRNNEAHIVEKRRYITYYLHNFNPFRYTKQNLGVLFNRDHSTIIHSLTVFNDFLKADAQLRKDYIIFKEKANYMMSKRNDYMLTENEIEDKNRMKMFLLNLCTNYSKDTPLLRMAGRYSTNFIKIGRQFLFYFLKNNKYHTFYIEDFAEYFNRSPKSINENIERFSDKLKMNDKLKAQYNEFERKAISLLKLYYKI